MVGGENEVGGFESLRVLGCGARVVGEKANGSWNDSSFSGVKGVEREDGVRLGVELAMVS